MGVLKLFEGTGDLYCAVATIKTSEGSTQKVVDGTAFSVGRAPDCVLSIPDVGISRLHLLVTIKRGEIYITDQGSSNGTFLNGEKIESKRLIHVKPTDEIKLGKSDVVLQFGCIEKHFKTDYIAESLLPAEEKDNLLAIIKASHHKSQEIVGMAQMQAEQLVKVATEKARNTENQTLLMQEEILSKAQVESQQIISDTKRKSAQMIQEAEETARATVQSIHDEAQSRRQEAEMFYEEKMKETTYRCEQKTQESDKYYQDKIKEAQIQGDLIIEKQTKLGHEMVEGLRQRTIENAEKEAKEKLASLFTLLDQKSEEVEKLKAECKQYSEDQKKVIDQDIAKMRQDFLKKFEFEKQTTLDEHQSRVAVLEADYLHKKQEYEEEESNRVQKVEDRIRNLNEKLDKEYAEKKVRLEKEHADKCTAVDRDFNLKKTTLEQEFQSRQAKLTEEFEKNRSEFTSTLEKQRNMLEKEVDGQRQTLQIVRSEIEDYTERHLELKAKHESLSQTVTGLQKSESELMVLLEDKRKQLKSVQDEHKRMAELIQETDHKYSDLQKAHASLRTQYENDHLNFRKELDQELQKARAEAKRKSSEYEELERIKLEEYKTQIAAERKQLDLNFERTKKEFELKTKEVIEFEKKKLEESKNQFLALMNNQRATVINELTKAIIKIEKRGDPAHAPELISHAVTQVFDSNVAEFSLTANSQSSAESSRTIRVQWLSYGFISAMALVFSFIYVIQPQINRNIAGTKEHTAAAAQVKERPKFQPVQDLEYRQTYVDTVIYTSKFSEIYLDDTIYDKWFKYVTDYMFQTWRVPEEKTIEVAAMAKSLVTDLRDRTTNLDAEFADKAIEKLRELEAETIKRMADTLGTQVKYEAFKRKEREFFEPYIQNQ